MNIKYDPKSDSMYIYFDPKKKSSKTIEIGEGINVDYAGKILIGIEILDASEKLAKKAIKNISTKTPTFLY